MAHVSRCDAFSQYIDCRAAVIVFNTCDNHVSDALTLGDRVTDATRPQPLEPSPRASRGGLLVPLRRAFDSPNRSKRVGFGVNPTGRTLFRRAYPCASVASYRNRTMG